MDPIPELDPVPPAVPVEPLRSGTARTALVLGVTALVLWLFPPLGIPVAILGLALGIGGLGAANRGQAVAGLVMSVVGLFLSATVVVAGVIVVMTLDEKTEGARHLLVRTDLQRIYRSAELCRAETGEWPRTIDDLLPEPEEAIRGELPRTWALPTRPKDPWGNDYDYELWGNGPVITSYGRDGVPGGVGPDADVSYPEAWGDDF